MNSHFNIYDNYITSNYSFDFMGEFVLSNSRFFLSKKNVIWSYDNNEYVFVKSFESLSKNHFSEFILPFSNFALNNFVKPDENHMSTYITMFLSAQEIDADLINYIKRYNKRKSYSFGLRGYSNFRIILFNSNTHEFFYNKDTKDAIKFYKEVLLS
ncbi:hypothetical protein CHL78_003580 [Romboutsia weinsteinii]|uniref:DUF8052 domain-containing protein n=2 Tax=Romboutsia weinsteinii TaxID=2020949 RepID=A0A371J8H5_9FIRM|nr:hypothetical protein CHL78_003580 [Romboutsia weinsteinii]